MNNKEKLFNQIISDYGDKIFRLCYSYAKNVDEQKDLHQEVLIKLWIGLNSFKQRSHLSTWIYRITVNHCLDYIRKSKTFTTVSLDKTNRSKELIDNRVDAEIGFIQSEEAKQLKNKIHELSVIDHILISLYLEDLKYRDIASIVGMSEKNVGVRIHRIKKYLNNNLKDIQK
jgi:RNA polymerase sigma-70 factor (ECF subfamily)